MDRAAEWTEFWPNGPSWLAEWTETPAEWTESLAEWTEPLAEWTELMAEWTERFRFLAGRMDRISTFL